MEHTTKQYRIARTSVESFRRLFAELKLWERLAECTEVRAHSRSVFVIKATTVGHDALREAMSRTTMTAAH
ncbi:hypothetical protein ACFYNO_39070 [Kitasatospora sp. NPDC006697]|uniref:hypothetical protein n=1 Tax=unclassified Kitasatospora TaxID=2633591 RepID=UPI00367DA4DD